MGKTEAQRVRSVPVDLHLKQSSGIQQHEIAMTVVRCVFMAIRERHASCA